MIIQKKISELTEIDLLSLKDNHIHEGKQIEYKSQLPGKKDKDKKEFLADISSFSNTAGGHIFFGIKEKEGFPNEIIGLENINPDQEILRLENSLRDAISPRLPGVTFEPIPLGNNNYVIAGFIPRSWVAPHMITFNNSSKFFARNSAGKYQLDVMELRTAFTASSTEAEKIKNFHAHRIGRILSDETPIPLQKSARIALHIIPMGAIGKGIHYDLKRFQESKNKHFLAPIDSDFGNNFSFNFNGVTSHIGNLRTNPAASYIQLFRNGVIEAVTMTFCDAEKDPPIIYSQQFEISLVKSLQKYITVFDILEIEEPIFILLSLLDVAGYNLPSPGGGFSHRNNIIPSNELIVPEILLDDRSLPAYEILKPAFDAVWNAGGLPQSPYYDSQGNWTLLKDLTS